MTATYLLAQPPGGWEHGWGHGGGWMAVWWPLAVLFWIAVLGLLVWLVLRSLRSSRGSDGGTARELLAQRYARGEIGDDEYRERLAVLNQRR